MAKRKTAAKASAKSAAKRTQAAKRTLLNTGVDQRYVRRAPAGTFKESDDVGKSLAADRRQKAKTVNQRAARATRAIESNGRKRQRGQYGTMHA